MDGFIAVHRKIVDNWVWKDKPFSKGQAWIDLIIMANHADTEFPLGNEIISAQKGEVVTSEVKLAARWGWSRHKVRTFISTLKTNAMLTQKPAHNRTHLMICNYSLYNDIPATRRTAKGQERDRSGTAAGHNQPLQPLKPQQPLKPNESIGASRFNPPDVDEIRNYCKKRNNNVDPQRFFDYYESNGWKVGKNPMKNWQAAVRNWEKDAAGKAPARKTFYDLAMEDEQ